MKTFLFGLIAAGALAGATNTTMAQGQNSFSPNDSKEHSLVINESVLPGSSVALNTSFVSAKALKNFEKSFKNAGGATWEKSPSGFVAKFSDGSIQNAIYYDKEGNWQGSMKSYYEDMLNKDVRTIVKQKYFDDKITYIQEIEVISSEGTPTYVVHLEGAHDLKLVRVQDGEMDVIEEYQKN